MGTVMLTLAHAAPQIKPARHSQEVGIVLAQFETLPYCHPLPVQHTACLGSKATRPYSPSFASPPLARSTSAHTPHTLALVEFHALSLSLRWLPSWGGNSSQLKDRGVRAQPPPAAEREGSHSEGWWMHLRMVAPHWTRRARWKFPKKIDIYAILGMVVSQNSIPHP